MNWKREMELAAARIAFPDLEVGDNEVSIDTSWDYGYGGCESCATGPSFEITVQVRNGIQIVKYRTYENSSAEDFWSKLMAA